MYKVDFNKPMHVHFIGIGGISMSGLAEILLQEGFTVSGSDMKESEITEILRNLGATIYIGQTAENITDDIDLVVFLRDPLAPKSHEPDVNKAVKLCDTHNVPLATNLATAELLIKALDRGDLEWREMYR